MTHHLPRLHKPRQLTALQSHFFKNLVILIKRPLLPVYRHSQIVGQGIHIAAKKLIAHVARSRQIFVYFSGKLWRIRFHPVHS